MAVAQHPGPDRVRTMGLRVPYFGLPLSAELGLPDGQPRLPVTEEVQRNTLEARRWRIGFGRSMGLPVDERGQNLDAPEAFQALQEAMAEPGARSFAAMSRDYPEELRAMTGSTIPLESLTYMMARDVALDLPGLDPRNVTLSGDRVVVWYAPDDEDCPPSHGKWLAEHFGARTRVFEGYGHLGGALIDHPGFLRELTD